MPESGTDREQETGATDPSIPSVADDIVLPFRTVKSDVLGRLVRLGPSVDSILKRHDYPEPVAVALGETLALTALLGASLKFDGRLILQTKTDGPLNFLVVNYQTPGHVRGYAGYDEDRLADLMGEDENVPQSTLLGNGHLAMTIDPDGDMDRHQGIVALEGQSICGAALNYFRQSEQLPTFIRLAVARHYAPAANGNEPNASTARPWTWRAGGLLLQYVTPEGGRHLREDETEEDEKVMAGEADENWQRARILAATVEEHELIDPMLSPQQLLYRLFHEEGVRVVEPRQIVERCRCSRARVEQFLTQFSKEELSDMREPDGGVSVTCEFCSTQYLFEPGKF